jgi:hypothetical protein
MAKGPIGATATNDYATLNEWGLSPGKADTWGGKDVPHPYVGPNQNTGDDKYASKMRANLARAQWADYKQRFQPYEDQMTAMAEEGPGDMVGTATSQAGEQFDAGLGVAARQRERYGLSGAPGEQTQRQNSLARGLATVGARNNARDEWENQRMGILTGNYGGK